MAVWPVTPASPAARAEEMRPRSSIVERPGKRPPLADEDDEFADILPHIRRDTRGTP